MDATFFICSTLSFPDCVKSLAYIWEGIVSPLLSSLPSVSPFHFLLPNCFPSTTSFTAHPLHVAHCPLLSPLILFCDTSSVPLSHMYQKHSKSLLLADVYHGPVEDSSPPSHLGILDTGPSVISTQASKLTSAQEERAGESSENKKLWPRSDM